MQGDEQAIGWDPILIYREPSTAFKIYVLFTLVAFLVVVTRLIRVWIAVPPFRLRRQANNPAYLKRLQASRASLKQWMGCTLVAWATLASTTVTRTCDVLLESRATGMAAFVWAIKDLSTSLSLGSFVALFLFLAQWHLHNRIELLRENNLPEQDRKI